MTDCGERWNNINAVCASGPRFLYLPYSWLMCFEVLSTLANAFRPWQRSAPSTDYTVFVLKTPSTQMRFCLTSRPFHNN